MAKEKQETESEIIIETDTTTLKSSIHWNYIFHY